MALPRSAVGSSIISSLSSQEPSGLYDVISGFHLLLPDSVTSTIQAITGSDSLIYVGTTQRGIWVNSVSNRPLGVVKNDIFAADALDIYPNPLISHGATMSFDLPIRSPVSLRLYDELGIMQSDIFEGEMNAGHHEIPFAGQWLPDGVYSVILSTGESRLQGSLVIER